MHPSESRVLAVLHAINSRAPGRARCSQRESAQPHINLTKRGAEGILALTPQAPGIEKEAHQARTPQSHSAWERNLRPDGDPPVAHRQHLSMEGSTSSAIHPHIAAPVAQPASVQEFALDPNQMSRAADSDSDSHAQQAVPVSEAWRVHANDGRTSDFPVAHAQPTASLTRTHGCIELPGIQETAITISALPVPSAASIIVTTAAPVLPNGRVYSAMAMPMSRHSVTRVEVLALRYRHTVRCLALMDTILTILSSVPTEGGLCSALIICTLPGPLCGYYGSQNLQPTSIAIYILLSGVKVIVMWTCSLLTSEASMFFFGEFWPSFPLLFRVPPFPLALTFCLVSPSHAYGNQRTGPGILQLYFLKFLVSFWRAVLAIPPDRLKHLQNPRFLRHIESRYLPR